MAMTINTNTSALNTQRALARSEGSLTTSLQRLSSGLRINSAKDDAAGLAISERITTQIRAFTVAERNASDALSFMQVADGAAEGIGNNLQRMRELSVQAANGSLNSGDRDNLQVEFAALGAEIGRLAQSTKFNNVALVNSGAASFSFQVGSGTGTNDQISVSTVDMRASTFSIDSGSIGIAGSSGTAALDAIGNLDCAINTVTTTRARFGSALNRTEAVISGLQIAIENQTAARGRVLDADFAAETANLTRVQILQQAGTAMLAQANQRPQNVLSLLR